MAVFCVGSAYLSAIVCQLYVGTALKIDAKLLDVSFELQIQYKESDCVHVTRKTREVFSIHCTRCTMAMMLPSSMNSSHGCEVSEIRMGKSSNSGVSSIFLGGSSTNSVEDRQNGI